MQVTHTDAYFELTNLMGQYANYLSAGAYELLPGLFTEDPTLELPGRERAVGTEAVNACFQDMAEAAETRGTPEFFSVFGQLTEVRPDGEEARCLWMYLSIVPDLETRSAQHRIGRIDQVCVKEGGVFKIKSHRQFVRTQLEPIALGDVAPLRAIHVPNPPDNQFADCDSDAEIGEMLDILNIHSRYEQYLHCGNWDMIDQQFSNAPDVSWTVGNTRKKFLKEHPDYIKEADGPGYSDEPPYWMGAKVGHENVIREGFGGMTIPFSPENRGLYCCSDMLLPLVVINRETGRAYTSVPSYGGFIMGPSMGIAPPHPVLNSIGRWHIEWCKEAGQWKMLHFFWSTLYEFPIDTYHPAHQADWLSTHADIHDWPPLPEPYECL